MLQGDSMYKPPYQDAPPAFAQLPLVPFSAPASALKAMSGEAFPSEQLTGPAPCSDKDKAVFVGLAHFNGGLQPCKVVPAFAPRPVRVGFGGREHTVAGEYFIVPLDAHRMEWVHASHGQLPPGRTPVDAGHESDGKPLYHAVALVDGVAVPGKVGPHLKRALVPYGGGEHSREYYQILCWRS